ncbi:MAG: hypothetical protein FWD47_01975 [Treponema sp.]|nr:hypothetical protein [Treponema sp.]
MKKNNVKKTIFILLVIAVILFNSCIGISYDIQLNRDGSGKITMEFKISRLLDDLGGLDGNESMPTIPLSRQDWERTVERIPGTKLSSFSTRNTAQDTIISVVVDFSNTEALLAILEDSGNKSSINHNGRTGSFDLIIFYGPTEEYDDNVLVLARSFFNGYDYTFSFSAPENSTMSLTNGSGASINVPQSIETSLSGKRVSFTANMMDVVTQSDGLGVRINW